MEEIIVESTLGSYTENEKNDFENLKAFDIYVKEGISGRITTLYITKINWLEQVYEQTARYLGLDSKWICRAIYENELGQQTSNGSFSLEEFNISEGDTITIYARGSVGSCGVNVVLYDAELNEDTCFEMISIHSRLSEFLDKNYISGDYYFVCRASNLATDNTDMILLNMLRNSNLSIGHDFKCEIIAIKKDVFDICYKRSGAFIAYCNEDNIKIFESKENWRKQLHGMLENSEKNRKTFENIIFNQLYILSR